MKSVPAILALSSAAIFLAACGPDVEIKFAQCKLEAAKTYPQQDISVPPDNSTSYDKFVDLCMEAQGFQWSQEAPTMKGSTMTCGDLYGRSLNARCYKPKPGILAKIFL